VTTEGSDPGVKTTMREIPVAVSTCVKTRDTFSSARRGAGKSAAIIVTINALVEIRMKLQLPSTGVTTPYDGGPARHYSNAHFQTIIVNRMKI